jgi:hypothetical protein
MLGSFEAEMTARWRETGVHMGIVYSSYPDAREVTRRTFLALKSYESTI